MTAAVLTIGCRLNQAESDCLRARLSQMGVQLVSEPARADTVFINTCTVTAQADRSCRALIRRVCRLAPKPRVVVLGCLAERIAAQLSEIPGVDEVWDNRRKQAEISGFCPFPVRSRALLKVQDGCDQGCSYCVVSRLRGEPVSLPISRVRDDFQRLIAAGFFEVVLTGLNLGMYNDDGDGLGRLLRALLEEPGRFRIRLASIEPDRFDDELLAVLGDARVCAHFHIPLQSGDEKLLKAMGRRYVPADYARLLERILRIKPEANIGADVIVGFPGEDESSFRQTLDFLRSVPVNYLHVFPYSPRPGTPAFASQDPIPREVKSERVAELRRFSGERKREYARRFVGSLREAVLEPGGKAVTDNYLRVGIMEHGARSMEHEAWMSSLNRMSGRRVLVRIEGLEESGKLIGRVEEVLCSGCESGAGSAVRIGTVAGEHPVGKSRHPSLRWE